MNPYQQMHYTALYGTKPKPVAAKTYDLFYNGQIVVSNAAKPLL